MRYLKTYKLFESSDVDSWSDTPPTTLEDQIAFSMKWYPTLYDSKYGRMKVLYHMYFGYGTEYRWSDGKLLNLDAYMNTDKKMYEYRLRRWDIDKEKNKERLDSLLQHWDSMVEISKLTGEEDDKYMSKLHKQISDIQDDMDNFNPFGKEYLDEEPLKLKHVHYSKYSPILSLPENIDPEYLNGAKEITNYLTNLSEKEKSTDTKLYKDCIKIMKNIKSLETH